MSSNKSRPVKKQPVEKRMALEPQRSHGKLRVAALLEAGATVIAKKGFQAATMAEIAALAGAPIGSLYRFFPNKEILADALIQRYTGSVDEAIERINRGITTMSIAALADAFLSLMADLQAVRPAIRALLEAHADGSAKRAEFRQALLRRIARTLVLRCPQLEAKVAASMAFVILHNIKMQNAINDELQGEARAGASAELREMTRIYLTARLKSPRRSLPKNAD